MYKRQLILLAPLTVAGRTVQLLYMTEPATGFFKQDMAGLGIAMGVVLGAALAAVLVLCRCCLLYTSRCV